MKKIGFIGAYDKTDLMIYISKILVSFEFKVLIIDTTTLQKTKYTVPSINPSKCYVTSYEDIDVAVGFEKMSDIKEYVQMPELNYDYILIDIDNELMFNNFEMLTAEKNYFVTAFDNYSLKRGLEIIGKMEEKIEMTKVLFTRNIEKYEDEYLNFLSFYYSIKWNKNKIYFPFEIGDDSTIIENQRNARISFKELSSEYKEGMLEIISQVAPEIKINEVRKIFKNV